MRSVPAPVVSAITAMADLGTCVPEKRFGVFDPRDRIVHRLGELVLVRRQIVDLLAIEDRVALHERNVDFLLGTVSVLLGALDRICVYNELAFLPLRTWPPSS